MYFNFIKFFPNFFGQLTSVSHDNPTVIPQWLTPGRFQRKTSMTCDTQDCLFGYQGLLWGGKDWGADTQQKFPDKSWKNINVDLLSTNTVNILMKKKKPIHKALKTSIKKHLLWCIDLTYQLELLTKKNKVNINASVSILF